MRSARVWMAAATVMTAATAANAADIPMYQPQPQPICVPRAQAHLWPGVPLCVEETVFGGWYLRGDIGFSNQTVEKIENVAILPHVNHVDAEFASAGLFGLGVGYNVNNWLRLDVTGEYRGKAPFFGLDTTPRGGGGAFTDEYRAKKSEWLFLANAYLDLGTWWCVTPFVGAGVGFSRISIEGFTDIDTPDGGVAFAPTASKWNFAWALHAGLAYQVSNNLALEFSYRYAHLGDGITGDVVTFNGVNDFNNPTTFKNINSHDLRFGVRWVCCDAPAPPPPPVVTKG
jgi:opacity protein-like surface antigen